MLVLVNCFSGKPSDMLFPKAADIASIKLRHNTEWVLTNYEFIGLGSALESMLRLGGCRQGRGGEDWSNEHYLTGNNCCLFYGHSHRCNLRRDFTEQL